MFYTNVKIYIIIVTVMYLLFLIPLWKKLYTVLLYNACTTDSVTVWMQSSVKF